MSDATVPFPAPQSASQLSENIGDVLASIRRLIAQDEATEAAAALPPARPLQAREVQQHPRPESLSRRRDILAEAQALTRRSEAAFGQSTAATAPLTLCAADRVTSLHAALPGRVATGSGREDQTAAPLVLTAPVASRPAAVPAATVEPRVRAPEPAPGEPPARSSAADAADAKPEQKAAAMTTAAPAGADPTPGPLTAATALPTPEAASGPQPLQAAAAPAQQQPAQPVAAPPQADTLPGAAAPVVEPVATVSQQPAQPAAALPPMDEDEDCTAAILREMIRDVVRQELNGDPSGRMPGGLRSMIMREVAQVLTQGARGGR